MDTDNIAYAIATNMRKDKKKLSLSTKKRELQLMKHKNKYNKKSQFSKQEQVPAKLFIPLNTGGQSPSPMSTKRFYYDFMNREKSPSFRADYKEKRQKFVKNASTKKKYLFLEN